MNSNSNNTPPVDTRMHPSEPAMFRKAKAAKYRPVLTASQIQQILFLAKSRGSEMNSLDVSLIATLSPFQAKIQNAGIAAAYTIKEAKPKANSLEALGAFEDSLGMAAASVGIDKLTYWSDCYSKFIKYPTECTLDVIEAAREHMYLNDLMNEEELSMFEAETRGEL
jgi:hypothetical protein